MNQFSFDEPEKLTVLIGEDDLDAILLLQAALACIDCEHTVKIVRDGQEALDYLVGKGQHEDRQAFPFPDVLLINLKMPIVSGLEMLWWLFKHPECNVLPTIVFSTSNNPADIKEAYDLGASACFVKPLQFDELTDILESTFKFWGKCVKPRLPHNCA